MVHIVTDPYSAFDDRTSKRRNVGSSEFTQHAVSSSVASAAQQIMDTLHRINRTDLQDAHRGQLPSPFPSAATAMSFGASTKKPAPPSKPLRCVAHSLCTGMNFDVIAIVTVFSF